MALHGTAWHANIIDTFLLHVKVLFPPNIENCSSCHHVAVAILAAWFFVGPANGGLWVLRFFSSSAFDSLFNAHCFHFCDTSTNSLIFSLLIYVRVYRGSVFSALFILRALSSIPSHTRPYHFAFVWSFVRLSTISDLFQIKMLLNPGIRRHLMSNCQIQFNWTLISLICRTSNRVNSNLFCL